jgi:lauroyl/myristoyl acyltransferase
MKFLNPVRNRIDDRYIKAPVILHEENAVEVMHVLGAHLDANEAVRISASGASGEPYEMPFLGGTLCLALGAPTLAILHDAPLIPTFCIPDGSGGFDLIVEAPLTDGSEKATFERARALARQYAVILERYVKRHPQVWRCWYMPTTWRPGRTA